MKRVKYLLIICMMGFLLTGCVRYNVNMDIKKDKSMEFSIIYAVDTSVFGENKDPMTSEEVKELEDKGFSVSEYNEGNMKGYSLTKKIKNIDEVSYTGDVDYSLSGLLGSSNGSYIFKVKKGFLKNTYIADFKFDSSDSDLSLGNGSDDYDDDYDYDYDDDYDDDYDYDEDYDSDSSFSNNADYSSLMSSMDLSFNVNLPYSAKSNNATTSKDDDKSLTWNLVTDSSKNIQFEFELYNMLYIYIGIGLLILVLILVFVIVSGSIKSKKKKNDVQNLVPSNTSDTVGNDGAQVVNMEQNNNSSTVLTENTSSDSVDSSVENVQEVSDDIKSSNDNTVSSPVIDIPLQPTENNDSVDEGKEMSNVSSPVVDIPLQPTMVNDNIANTQNNTSVSPLMNIPLQPTVGTNSTVNTQNNTNVSPLMGSPLQPTIGIDNTVNTQNNTNVSPLMGSPLQPAMGTNNVTNIQNNANSNVIDLNSELNK